MAVRLKSMAEIRRGFTLLCQEAGVAASLLLGSICDFPRSRDLAYCDLASGTVYVSPRIRRLSWQKIHAVLMHELAHASLAHLPEHTELQADAEAERLFGYVIYYDANDIQTLADIGRRRPAYLPR